MNEHPIIFSTDMVKAILDGRKTMTRRVIKPQPNPCRHREVFSEGERGYNAPPDWQGKLIDWIDYKYEGREGWFCHICGNGLRHIDEYSAHGIICPYGQVGDRLWVKERHKLTALYSGMENVRVKCEYSNGEIRYFEWADIPKKQRQLLTRIKTWEVWRSARFMYKFSHRYDPEITELRVERLWEITEEDAQAEGVVWISEETAPNTNIFIPCGVKNFHLLWDRLNAKRGYGWDTNPWVWVISFKKVDNEKEST